MMEVWCLCVSVLVWLSVTQAGAQTMTIHPKIAAINRNENVTVMCDYDTKDNIVFKVCLFKVRADPLDEPMQYSFNLTRGNLTREYKEHNADNSEDIFFASYHGEGLARGQCGVKMRVLVSGRFLVECRVAKDKGGWDRDLMMLVVNEHAGTPTNISEASGKAVVEQQGNQISMAFVSKEPIQECKLYLPNLPGPVILSSTCPSNETNGFTANFNAENCTLNHKSLTEKESGVVWCLYKINADKDYKTFQPKIVAVLGRTPETPELKLPKTNYNEGDTLKATCKVKDARPVARIVWLLGGEDISNDTQGYDFEVPFKWPWEVQSITQNLTRELVKEDNGKNLTCHVFYPAFSTSPWMNSTNTTISVKQSDTTTANTTDATADEKLASMAGSGVGTSLAITAVVLVVVVGAVGAVYWRRRRRAPSHATEIVRHPMDTGSGNQTDGSRSWSFIGESPFTETTIPRRFSASPRTAAPADTCDYAELNWSPPPFPQSAPPDGRVSATCGEVVQYEEIGALQSSFARAPDKKAVAEEPVIYAQVQPKKDRPNAS